jgi:uncharacterized C2H2 Zn-finger protein
MAEKFIKCPFCGGAAHVRQNVRLDPFISCPRCGAINARGAKYREYIESHQYERSQAERDTGQSGKVDEQSKQLYKNPVKETGAKEDWLAW